MDNYNQQEYARKLLHSSTLDHNLQERVEKWIRTCEDVTLLSKVIKKLQDNQLDPLTGGLRYTATDIIEHMKKIL